MDLLVDSIKPGFGTTNNGNTTRKFFSNPELSSKITFIDKTLIYRFSIILKAINCQFLAIILMKLHIVCSFI